MCCILQPIARSDREVMARLRNCVLALAEHRMLLYDTSVLYAYDLSLKFQVLILCNFLVEGRYLY